MTTFADDGFLVIPKMFSGPALHSFETRILELYEMTAARLGIGSVRASNYHVLCDILEAMEENHKEDAYKVQKLIENDDELKEIFGQSFHTVMMHLLNCIGDLPPKGPLKIIGPGLFINRPKTHRLLYKWHSERHYYPHLNRFINCHFPLFGDKWEANGAMSVMPGSHKGTWVQNEYSGGPHTFYQREISESQLTGYTPLVVEEKRGELCAFHPNLVHRSNENKSAKYSFAAVCRVYSPEDAS